MTNATYVYVDMADTPSGAIVPRSKPGLTYDVYGLYPAVTAIPSLSLGPSRSRVYGGDIIKYTVDLYDVSAGGPWLEVQTVWLEMDSATPSTWLDTKYNETFRRL